MLNFMLVVVPAALRVNGLTKHHCLEALLFAPLRLA
jgi:hypothetical protein